MYGLSRSGRDCVSSSSEEEGAERASNMLGLLSSRKDFPGGSPARVLGGAVTWYRWFEREGRERGRMSASSIEGKPNSIASSNFEGER